MARVWEGSKHAGSELLMLLAIADFADDNGRAYPSISSLALKCRTKPRYAMVLLEALSAGGELEIRRQQGAIGRGGRTNLYRIVFDRLGTAQTEVVNQGAPVNQSAVVHQGAASSAPGFREVVNQGAAKPSGTVRTTKDARKRAAAFDAAQIELPDWLPSESWMAWVADRKERRKPITQRAAEAQIKALERYRGDGHQPADVIEYSISGGYQGLFPPKHAASPGARPAGARSLLDADEQFTGAAA
jgi:hypothetical protein